MSLLSYRSQSETPFSLPGLPALLICILITCLVACASPLAAPPANNAEPILTVTPAPTAESLIATPPVEPTPGGPLNLLAWWPDALAPAGQEKATLQLADDVDTFHASVPNVRVEIRLKKAQDAGGVMETLRAASAVAPRALPDVTLLRRTDLLAAVAAGYIQPLEGLVTSAVLGDLYPAALDLGRVDGVVYGLPYALDVEHIAYRPTVLTGSFARFDDVLADQQAFVFPAGVTAGLSDVVFLQYLSAGGTATELSRGRPNQAALRTVLAFYQQAVTQAIIDPSVLDYARSDDYLFQLGEGKLNAAVVTSTQYLSLLADGQALDAAPIPLARGEPSTVVNGWMWVMVTKDKERQALAVRFMEWMMEAERLAAYTRLVNMLPARRAAMRVWDGGAFATLGSRLLLNARLPLNEDIGNTTLGAMQNALAAVIGGQRSPDEAVNDVIEQVNP